MTPTEWIIVLVHKVLQLPGSTRCGLIAPSLTLFVLLFKPDDYPSATDLKKPREKR
jgi:hypothetical protein